MDNSYMDDVPGSVKTQDGGIKLMEEITLILKNGWFNIKEWAFSDQKINRESTETQRAVQTLMDTKGYENIEKVLGLGWDTEKDNLKYIFKPTESYIESTKRECLSTIYSIYDPLGLLTPVTVAAKIILRKIWATWLYQEWMG